MKPDSGLTESLKERSQIFPDSKVSSDYEVALVLMITRLK